MKKQFYIAPFSEIVGISSEGSLLFTASQALITNFWEDLMDGGEL